jgi:hypothetical protein
VLDLVVLESILNFAHLLVSVALPPSFTPRLPGLRLPTLLKTFTMVSVLENEIYIAAVRTLASAGLSEVSSSMDGTMLAG